MWVENRAGTALQPCLSRTSTTFFIPHHLWMAFPFGRKCLLCDHYLCSVTVRRKLSASCAESVKARDQGATVRHTCWAFHSETSHGNGWTQDVEAGTVLAAPRWQCWVPGAGVQLGLLAMRARHADCLVCGTQQRHWAQFPHSSSSTSGFGGLLLEA